MALLAGRLDSLSPLAVLDRGYAVVWRTSDGGIVRGTGDVQPGDRVSIRLARALLEATLESLTRAGAGSPSSQKPL
jgi:exodeoxyribonuclease VII large subunit